MRFESGPAAYDRNYYLVFLLLCLFMGAYFLYDYQLGYPKKNFEDARKALIPLIGAENVPQTLPETPTKPEVEALITQQPTDPADVRAAFGEPLFTKPGETAGETLEYFVSAYGMARVPVLYGRANLKQARWRPWEKSKEEIRLQLYCALVAFLIGLFVLRRVYKAATLRVVIDDEGMAYARRRIPFENMLRLCDYSRKGWVDLYYQHGPQERKLRIDNQKVRKFDEIIDTLCEAKGFEDPRQVAEEAQAPAAAEPPPDAPDATTPSDEPNTDRTDGT
jgi:hypothetical protein